MISKIVQIKIYELNPQYIIQGLKVEFDLLILNHKNNRKTKQL